MPLIHPATKLVNAKIVYYGAGEAGKTTNLRQIYQRLALKDKGDFRVMPLFGDQTTSFFFFPIDVGKIWDFQLRMHLYTVEGQMSNHEAVDRLMLTGADGIVFVVDSQEQAIERNLEQLQLLRMSLTELGKGYAEVPIVFQYNKRDLPDVLSLEELNHRFNPMGRPYLEASAARGTGVVESLARVSKLVLQRVKQSIEMLAPGWDEDPVTRFVRSQNAMQPAVVGEFRNLGGGMGEKGGDNNASRHRDVFGRSWL
jgi:signal recognition particle receptor subunit beta